MSVQNAQNQAWNAYDAGLQHAQANHWDKALPLFAQAVAFNSKNIRFVLFLGAALWHTGESQAALQLWSLGADHDAMLRLAQYQPQADPFTRQMSQLADSELRSYLTGLQSDAVNAVSEPGRIQSALWPQTHAGEVMYPDNGPKPYMFYAPDLPETPIFERTKTSWTALLEAVTDDIRREYLAIMDESSDGDPIGQPYVGANSFAGPEWNTLKGQPDWTSIHLYQDGKPQDAAARCSITCKILSDLPLVYHQGHPMEVFFSVLKAKTHIPPHYGLANCRVTVHLPLIIPSDCAIRVHKTEHKWTPGETLIFDDSFDHEAWNKSDQTRVVLIFEAWRPDMTSGEIEAAEVSYKMRGDWMRARQTPDLQRLIAAM